MMTLEYIKEQKEKYQQKVDYFNKLGFDTLTSDFQNIVSLIGEMEDYMKEKENGENCKN